MKKKRNKFVVLISSLLIIPFIAFPVRTEAREGVFWNEFAPEGVSEVEDTFRPRIRSSLMYSGYIKLADDNGKAGVYGETLALRTCDRVGLNLFLDRYNGESYGNYTLWETVETNTSMNMKSYTVSVPKGYYYRLHGYHYVEDGSDFENGETLTQGLKIPQY